MRKQITKRSLRRVMKYWSDVGQPVRTVVELAMLSGVNTKELRKFLNEQGLYKKLELWGDTCVPPKHRILVRNIQLHFKRNPPVVLPWLFHRLEQKPLERRRRSLLERIRGYQEKHPPIALSWLVARLDASAIH